MFSDNSPTYLLSVSSVKEVAAPLGGISVLYTISFSEGADSLSVEKTFREIEDFVKKLGKKINNIKLPNFDCPLEDATSRRAAVNSFMKFLSDNSESISAALIKELLGFESLSTFPLSSKKQNPITTEQQKEKNSNDIFLEFQNANKLTKQQLGRASFFDEIDDDDDLFGSTASSVLEPVLKQVVEKEPKEIIEAANNNVEEDLQNLSCNEKEAKEEYKFNLGKRRNSKFDEEEIDDSILRLDENIDNLDHLLKPKEPLIPKEPENPKPTLKPKPVPPPKRPGLTVKPVPHQKPSQPETVQVTEELDINRYINSEQAANSKEAKLFD